jgi:hypothetical protein
MLSWQFQKIKQWMSSHNNDILVAALIFLTGLGSFGLGRLSVVWQDKESIQFSAVNQAGIILSNSESAMREVAVQQTGATQKSVLPIADGAFVASKSGAAYHYPWCSGASRIKEENKVWFDTTDEARAKGYRPAKNCPGLQ